MSTKPGLVLQRATFGSCPLEVTALKDRGRDRKERWMEIEIKEGCAEEQNKGRTKLFWVKARRLENEKKRYSEKWVYMVCPFTVHMLIFCPLFSKKVK